jgi:hypothetical protein
MALTRLDSRQATFTPAGTGAVVTTVQDKLRESVSVLDFGADPTGVTDSTAAIQNAVNASLNVYIPAGNYLVDDNWVPLREGSSIYGDGIGATRLFSPRTIGASVGILYANSGAAGTQLSDIMICDIEFDGLVNTLGFSEFKHLVSLHGVKDVLIERCKFTGFRSDGVYIGSGVNGADERHNTNVTVRDCVFDGVNSDNRNGISVIDGNGIHILNNTFRNCTRSNMPGPIDVEPDANAFAIVRDINIVGNTIESYGGGFGIVVYLDSGPFTAPLYGVNISDNYISGNTNSGGASIQVSTAETISSSTQPMAIKITNNTVVSTQAASKQVFILKNVRDVIFEGNTFINGSVGVVGKMDSADLSAMDVKISKNMFYRNGNVHGAFTVASVDNLEIDSNIIEAPFYDAATIGCRFFGDGITTVSNRVTLTNNTFIKGASQTISVGVSGHTLSTDSNIYYGNRDVGGVMTNQFTFNNAYITQANFQNATESTVLGILPDSYRLGDSWNVVNGDKFAPDVFTQGIVETRHYFSGQRKFIVQTYYSANNGGNEERQVWVRKAASATNTWGNWTKLSLDYSSVAPTSRTWDRGDVVWKSDPSASGTPGWVCVQGGTFETLSGVTGSITSGTPLLTLNTVTGVKVGLYLTIVGVTGIKKVISMSGLVATLDSNADATVTGAAVAYSPAIFKAMADLAA